MPDLPKLALSVLIACAFTWLLDRGLHTYWDWKLGRAMRRLGTKRKSGAQPFPRKNCAFVVSVDEIEVRCSHRDGSLERVAWAELERVDVVTTDDGPFAPDIYWLLRSSSGGCAVPREAQGHPVLLERLLALPNFDHQNFIRAQGSIEKACFQVWQRKAAAMNAKTV